MSAAGRPGRSTRTALDVYATPAWCTKRLVERLIELGTFDPRLGRPLRALGPCAGDGAIPRAFDETLASAGLARLAWTLVDVRPEVLPALREIAPATSATADFLALPPEALSPGEFDLSVENPPYGTASDFILRCAGKIDRSFWLLRMGFLESEERLPLFRDLGVPDVYVLPNRPCYKRVWAPNAKGEWRLGTSDASAYGWFDFRKRPNGRNARGALEILASTSEVERAAARELAPVEDKDGNVLWSLGEVCEACGAPTRFSTTSPADYSIARLPGSVVCASGHSHSIGAIASEAAE